MRQFSALIAILLCFVTACEKQTDVPQEHEKTVQAEIEKSKVYFFYYNGCPYCHDALDYVNAKYPDLEMSMVNIKNPAGYQLFTECAAKFNIGRNVGTPLFCMGDDYLMGWGPDAAKRFDEYVKPFIK